MRQAGIIAAGALYALRNHRGRLVEDHANAKALAGVAGIAGLELDPPDVETNMVFFNVRTMPAAALVEKLKAAGVLMLALGPERIRAVTSLAVARGDIDEAIRRMAGCTG